jgi:hypothetical protein
MAISLIPLYIIINISFLHLLLYITRSWERIFNYSRSVALSGVSLWEVSYFVLAWQCLVQWETPGCNNVDEVCARPTGQPCAEDRSEWKTVVSTLWLVSSASNLILPYSRFSLHNLHPQGHVHAEDLLCTVRQKKSTENNKCPNLEKADCNNKFTWLFMLNFSVATMYCETYPDIIKKIIFLAASWIGYVG